MLAQCEKMTELVPYSLCFQYAISLPPRLDFSNKNEGCIVAQ